MIESQIKISKQTNFPLCKRGIEGDFFMDANIKFKSPLAPLFLSGECCFVATFEENNMSEVQL